MADNYIHIFKDIRFEDRKGEGMSWLWEAPLFVVLLIVDLVKVFVAHWLLRHRVPAGWSVAKWRQFQVDLKRIRREARLVRE
jgi:hypothetical protein